MVVMVMMMNDDDDGTPKEAQRCGGASYCSFLHGLPKQLPVPSSWPDESFYERHSTASNRGEFKPPTHRPTHSHQLTPPTHLPAAHLPTLPTLLPTDLLTHLAQPAWST